MLATHQVRSASGEVVAVTTDTDTATISLTGTDGNVIASYYVQDFLAAPGARLTVHTDVPAWNLDAEQYEAAQAGVVQTFHRQAWDMPTLTRRESVLTWLVARYEVHFGIVSDVIIRDLRTGAVTPFTTTDVREALDSLLDSIIDAEVTA